MNRAYGILSLTCLAALLLSGCQAKPAPSSASPVTGDAVLDPCADQLHELCEGLLMYYLKNKTMPQSLLDLVSVGTDGRRFKCPVSGRPYLYRNPGLTVPGREGKLVIFDALPCHSGLREGILVEPPKPGQPLVVSVIRVPENAVEWPNKTVLHTEDVPPKKD